MEGILPLIGLEEYAVFEGYSGRPVEVQADDC